MYGFEWQEKRGVEGTGFVRALRSLLTAQLPSFFPVLRSIVEQSICEEIERSPVHDGNGSCTNRNARLARKTDALRLR